MMHCCPIAFPVPDVDLRVVLTALVDRLGAVATLATSLQGSNVQD